jgi:hypothetical protein
MHGSIVVVLNIGKNIIPCVGVIEIVHAKNVHDHPIDELSLVIILGVEGSRFGELGVQR